LCRKGLLAFAASPPRPFWCMRLVFCGVGKRAGFQNWLPPGSPVFPAKPCFGYQPQSQIKPPGFLAGHGPARLVPACLILGADEEDLRGSRFLPVIPPRLQRRIAARVAARV
jgi:hypothetical protein